MTERLRSASAGDNASRAIPDDLLTPAEAAAQLKISKAALYERIGRGDIPSYRFGRAIRLRAHHLADYLERGAHPVAAPSRYVRTAQAG